MEFIIIFFLLIIMVQVSYLVFFNKNKNRHQKTRHAIFIDTSTLIDGRILPIFGYGFLSGDIFIPKSVIGELQYIADQSDAKKRNRARYGLDIVARLQAIDGKGRIKIYNDDGMKHYGVDQTLIKLAKKHQGSICTIDYNLNKVAKIEGVEVLNINDLAISLRMSYLPGERMVIELTSKGSNPSQAVSHLSDGTMVVIEKAGAQVGSIVEIEFTKGLQTSAGKMMFAKLVRDSKKPKLYHK